MMNDFRTILSLFIFLTLVSCQAKQGDSGSGLISGHKPATNSFTLVTPATKTYVASETISFTVDFPFDMDVDTTSGSPRLRLTVGATTRYATYSPQGDLRKLVFDYTFAPGENDTNGIDVNALELNGSTIQFEKDGVPTNCDVATFVGKNLPTVKVDSASPTITAFALTNLPGMYNEGKTLLFRMTFSETVVVTGTPKFVMAFDTGGSVDVQYVSGTGSNILVFAYTVGPTVADVNGFNSITSPLVNGTITDAVGNISSLDFSAFTGTVITNSAAVHVSGVYPFIVDTDFPINDTYPASKALDFTLEFDQPVTVTGSPFLTIDIDGAPRQAAYNGGSGTKFITFSYTTVPGDVDLNGITVTGSINQNAGNIVITSMPAISFFTDTLNNVIPLPDTTGIIVNAVQPKAVAVARNIDTTVPVWNGPAVDNVWNMTQELLITVTFNTPMFVTQPGTPSIPITIGGTVRQATYLSGGNGQTALVFKYTVVEGDLDTDGTIDIGPIALNGGIIVDGANTNATLTLPSAGLTNTKIDAVRPVISNVTAPASLSYSRVATGTYQDLIFTVNWSEPVNYATTGSITMDVAGTATPLVSYNNNVSAITHRPTGNLVDNVEDTDGVTIGTSVTGSVVKDQAGNAATAFTFSAPNTTGVKVDTKAPVVSSITAITTTGSFKENDTIDFSVTFNESVTVLIGGGYPRIPITVGGTTAYMVARTSGTGLTHTFRYTVAAGHTDTDGIQTQNTVENNGTTAYVRDIGRNNAATGIVQAFASHLIDTTAPTIPTAGVISNGTYETGDNLTITLNYSEKVNVDTVGGTRKPKIAVTIGSNTRDFEYFSGTGTQNIVFRYTLIDLDFDIDGLPSSIISLNMNGGSIVDEAKNPSPTTFPSQNLSGIKTVFANTDLWVEYDFVNKAKAGSPVVDPTVGAIGTLDTCGTGPCRRFDGDDRISVTLDDVQFLYIVFKTPGSSFNDRDIFGPELVLRGQWPTSAFDFRSPANFRISLNGGAETGWNTNFGVGIATNSSNVLQVEFGAARSVSGNIVDTAFDGSIAEIWAITGSLTPAQKTILNNYLNAKY